MKSYATIITLSGIFFLAIMTSCISYTQVGTVELGETSELKGVEFTTAPVSHARVRLEGKNTTDVPVRMSFYAAPTVIGRKYIAATSLTNPGNKQYARFSFEPREITLAPGESGEVGMFLQNWFDANRNFSIPVEVRVTDEVYHHYLQLNVDQDDLFADPPQLFQENKLGWNQPGVPQSKQSPQASL